jgi:putative DNA primase/helicase
LEKDGAMNNKNREVFTLAELLTRLVNVKSSGGQFTARCPSHDDEENSLSVTEEGGRILLHCHAGCSPAQVCAALDLKLKDLFLNSRSPGKESQMNIVEIYDYKDEKGNLLYQNVRLEPKGFRQRRFDEGEEVWNLRGVKRVLYRLPELIAGLQENPERYVLLTEGEKDCDNVRALGFVASSFKNWRREFNTYVAGVNVVLLVDHDAIGIRQADAAAKLISEAAASVKVVNVHDSDPLPEKHGKDVSDWLEAGHSADELRQIINETPVRRIEAQSLSAKNEQTASPLSIVRLSDVEPEEVSWLWFPYVALGKLTILEGEEGLGKSWLTCALASAVSTGNGFPPDFEKTGAGNVLMLSAEDGLADTIKPRLDASGANTARVFAVNEPLTLDDMGFIKLEGYIAEVEPKLIIIDPLFAYTPTRTDINSANQSRAVSARLADIAGKYDCAIMLVRHIGKAKGYGDARAAGLGSIDWRAAVRSVLLVGKDPTDERERAIVQTKNNLAPLGVSLGFTIEGDANGAHFLWKGKSDLTASQILASIPDENERSGKLEAIDFLREALSDGAQEVTAINEQASTLGITPKQLRTAREKLGVKSKKHGGGFGKDQEQFWTWYLPEVKSEDA